MSAKLARYLQIERNLASSSGSASAVSLRRDLDAAHGELEEEERQILAKRRNGPRPGDRAYRPPG